MNSVTEELIYHILEYIEERDIIGKYVHELHHYMFNEDYYLIYYSVCDEWIKKHNLDIYEILGTIQEYEEFNYGQITTKLDNSETIVNMYVYIKGQEILNDLETITNNWNDKVNKKIKKDLIKELKNLIA